MIEEVAPVRGPNVLPLHPLDALAHSSPRRDKLIVTLRRLLKPLRRQTSDMEALVIGTLYSNEEIYKNLLVSNAGGIRLRIQDKAVLRAVVLPSVPT